LVGWRELGAGERRGGGGWTREEEERIFFDLREREKERARSNIGLDPVLVVGRCYRNAPGDIGFLFFL